MLLQYAFWIGAAILLFGSIYVVASGNGRGRPHVLWPLLAMTGAWVLVAAYEVWFEFIYDPTGRFDIRVDLVLFAAALGAVTISCTVWIFGSLLASARRSRK